MSKITINTVGQLLDNVETEEKATKLVFYIKELQQENKQLKEQINEYQKAVDETTSEKIDLQDENKQLKEEIENIKDFNNKLQASKDRLDKDDYNLAHILTELEEWLKETSYYEEYDRVEQDTMNMILNKIQKLKEKYK